MDPLDPRAGVESLRSLTLAKPGTIAVDISLDYNYPKPVIPQPLERHEPLE
jgi:hypothetical protein